MQERCGYRSKQGVCGSPRYASKTVKVLVAGRWVKQSIVVCKDHSYKRRVNQKMRVKSCDPCGESSLYWNWVGSNNDDVANDEGESAESFVANPDVLSEEDGLWARTRLSEEDQEAADAAMKAAEALLTDKQKEVFDLLVYERRNQYEIAAILRLERGAVQKRIDGIVKKLSRIDTIQNQDL